MIDTHCHILPGVDDGAQTQQDALDIARQLVEVGFQVVLATPHVVEGDKFILPSVIREKVHTLNQLFQQENIPLQVLPGAENYIFPELAAWYREGKIITLADTQKYILVELPTMSIPHYTEQVLFELQLAGLTPVIAHPERNRELYHNPEKLVEWVNKGIQLQINLGSFMGRYGSGARNLAKALLLSEMVHFIGSDMHHVSQHNTYLKSIHYLLNEMHKQQLTAAATAENPANILEGVNWSPPKPQSINLKKDQSIWQKMKQLILSR